MSKAIITFESNDDPAPRDGEPAQLNVKLEFDPPIPADRSLATAAQLAAIRLHSQLVDHSVYAEQIAIDGREDRRVIKGWEGPSLHGPEI